jgi:hypothetical protein
VEFRSVNGITPQEVSCAETLNQETGSLIDAVKVTPLLAPVSHEGALLGSLRPQGQAIRLHLVAVIEAFLTGSLGLSYPTTLPAGCEASLGYVVTHLLTGSVKTAIRHARAVLSVTAGRIGADLATCGQEN